MRGATLAQMVSDLREELRRANTPASSPEDRPTLIRTLNHVARVIYYDNDWPHLTKQFTAIAINAGQRYYDFPAGLDPDRIIKAQVKWAEQYEPVERGISFEDYNAFDPEADDRSSPILKWDVKFTGTTEQIELWPLPNSDTQTLNFFGVQAMPVMVNDTDTCPLESEVIVLYAAAELASKDSPDKEAKLKLGQELLRQVKMRINSAGARPTTNGLGRASSYTGHPRAQVRVRG